MKYSDDVTIFDGDTPLIQDTDPDPFINELQCQTDINKVTLDGLSFNLARTNAMSYWYLGKAQTFTKDQVRRIRTVLRSRAGKNLSVKIFGGC